MKKFIFTFIFIILVFSLFSEDDIKLEDENKIEKDINYFINKAFQHHSAIKQAKYDIKKYKNLQLEAISVYTPKINGMTWIAPMYTIRKTDDPWETETDFTQWGPFFNLDLQFQQPVFAFTRVISGIRAAREGQEVAKADVEIVKWQVAKDVRLYYYGIIFAKTMLKTLKMADDLLSNAIKLAEESLAEGKFEITEVQLNQLKYFYTQIPINRSFINKSLAQAQEALELSTGERLEDEDIPPRLSLEPVDLKDFDFYYKLMMENRPLLKKLNHGINATKYLMYLEFKSMIPVLFLGGFLKFTAAPTVDMHSNKFMLNNYNTFSGDNRGVDGGIAMGLFIQFDPVKSIAKGLQKKAELDKLKELHNYAMEGFPIQLDKVLKDLDDLKVKIENLKDAIDNAESWMFFAANAFAIGGGEARDIMEGLAAYVKAKTDYYQSIYEFNKLLGELCEIVGVDVSKL